jgi:hypothetical protein
VIDDPHQNGVAQSAQDVADFPRGVMYLQPSASAFRIIFEFPAFT